MPKTIVTQTNQLSEVFSNVGLPFAIDIETSGLDYNKDFIVGIALHFSNDNAYYIVLKHTKELWDGSTYLEEYLSLDDIRAPLAGLLTQTVPICLHNSKFDLHFFDNIDITARESSIFDTLLAAQLLDENRQNGLKNLAPSIGIEYDKYHSHKKYKGFKNDEILGGSLQDVSLYAMNDVEATWKLYLLFDKQLRSAKEPRSDKLYSVFTDIWMPLSRVLREMEAHGVTVDREAAIKLRDEYTQKALDAKTIVLRAGYRQLVERYERGDILPDYYSKQIPPILADQVVEQNGQRYVDIHDVRVPVFRPTPRSNERFLEFNPGSPKQMHDLIYEQNYHTDVPLKMNPSGENLAVDKENLKIIQFYNPNVPAYVQSLLDWKESEKFISTYLDTFIEQTTPEDSRIHCSFNQAVNDQGQGGTVTGRISCSHPNMMNLPSRGAIGDQTRSLVIPEEGHDLIAADYNNFEMRVLGHYSQDETIMKAFSENLDLHIAMGAKITNTTYEALAERYVNDDKEAKKTRNLGKTINFAAAYGIGPTKLRRFILVNNEYELTQAETIRWLEEYDDLYNGAKEWKDSVARYIREHGYVATIGGRLRRLPDAFSKDRQKRGYAERQGINTIIQGSCGDIICEAMVAIQPCLKALQSTLLLQVHDELLATAPKARVEEAKVIMTMLMSRTPLAQGLRIPLLVEATNGANWYAAKS